MRARLAAAQRMFRRETVPDLIRGGRRFADENMRKIKIRKVGA
jgi:hypothetical protein